ncbi:MAG TPA: FAD-binding oxidoreductase [Myxococcales bacterium]|nr:FAD-binding oxidoreductase [Myxococcales bacterium]
MMPVSPQEAAEMLRQAPGPLVIVGGGTQLRPGFAANAELVTTLKLNRMVEYAPSDQVVCAEAGMTLATLQAELSRNGQRLAIDPPQPEKATLGGIIAANSFGPLRTRYGSVRDLIIGISVVLSDGTPAKGGGKVVKTVAGFDLPKLMCGSYGTLALITTATFRVHPVPERSITLLARKADPVELVKRVRALQLEPAAMLSVDRDVHFRFEGFAAGVAAQREKLRELEEAPWPAPLDAPVRLKVAALPAQLPQVEKALAPLQARLEWLPMVGIGFAHTQAEAASIAAARRELLALGGSLVVEKAPFALAPLDVFGPPPPSLPLQKALKDRLDPRGVLAPGRFTGGT